eukprot:scaffold4844_cov45-Attheya_sp.AAC.2
METYMHKKSSFRASERASDCIPTDEEGFVGQIQARAAVTPTTLQRSLRSKMAQASPSILILRSACTTLPSRVKSAGKSRNEGIVENRSDGGAEPWTTSTFLDESIERLALSPIVCDITVLPETLLDDSFASVDQDGTDEIAVEAHGYHFLQRQTLNPCGMDNVIVMPPLSSSDKEISDDSYLLSLFSCTTSISLESQDLILPGNLDPSSVKEEMRLLAVKPNPSTFVFDFHKSNSSGRTHGGHIANLDVEFDLSLAHQQLVEA